MRRSIVIIVLTIFVDLIGFGLIIPLLPIYAQRFGVAPVWIGVLFGAFSAAQLLGGPYLGGLSDRIGRRPVLVWTLFLNAISFVMMAYATNIYLLFLARLVSGFAAANISVARAYIVDVAEENERARAFGAVGAAYGLGFVVGPALAALLAPLGLAAPIWACFGLSMVAFLLALKWLPETQCLIPAGLFSPLRTLPYMIKRDYLKWLLLIDLLFWAAASEYQTTISLLTSHRFHFGVREIGFLATLLGVSGALVQLFVVQPLVHRIGAQLTMFFGFIFCAVGLEAAALSFGVPGFVVAMIPAGIGVGLAVPTINVLIARNGRPEELGLLFGSASAIESLARIIGPVLGNGLLQKVAGGAAYGTAAIMMGAAAILTAVMQLYPPGASDAVAAGH